MTGRAPTGSSTPPSCDAAERCTCFPTWAHEPTRACESIIVPSSTYAPMFTYAGGIMITDGARYAPVRTLLPPGTILTPFSAVNFLAGIVSLSKKENWPSVISVSLPRRKPLRITSLTHEFTFHSPSIFSATLTLPFSRSAIVLLNLSISVIIIKVRYSLLSPPSGHKCSAETVREGDEVRWR